VFLTPRPSQHKLALQPLKLSSEREASAHTVSEGPIEFYAVRSIR